MFGMRLTLGKPFNRDGAGGVGKEFQFIHILVCLRLGHVGRDEADKHRIFGLFFKCRGFFVECPILGHTMLVLG